MRPSTRLLHDRSIRQARFPDRGDLQGGVIVTPPSEGDPVLPQRLMSAALPTVTGTTYTPTTFAELQSAVNAATYGDEIVLTAGQTYTGNLVLPAKTGWSAGQYILIRSSAVDSLPTLPASGVSSDLSTSQPRVVPSRDAAFLATLKTTNVEPAVDTLPGSNGWYVWGIRFECTSTSWNYGVVYAGPGRNVDSTALADLTSHFVFQQCVWYNDPYTSNVVKLLRIQTDYCAVANCHLYGGNLYNGDANAIWVFKSRGPILLHNNFLCANGENVLTGGADQPSWFQPYECDDVQVFYNRCWKDRRWFEASPTYVARPADGQKPGIKNVFELKFGRRWHFYGNIFDGSTTQGQSGQGLALKTVNQNAAQNTAETCHITVDCCLSKNVGTGLYISALETYNGGTGIPVHDVLVRDCAFLCPGTPFLGENNKGGYIAHRDQVLNVRLDHVTTLNSPTNTQYLLLLGGGIGTGLDIQNSIFAGRSVYGVWSGDSAVQGTAALTAEIGSGNYTFQYNALVRKDNTAGAGMSTKYAGNTALYFPADDTALGLDETTGKLLAGSPALAGGAYASNDGTDLGCRWTNLDAAIAGVEIAAELTGYGT
jgi:hypothetical protein